MNVQPAASCCEILDILQVGNPILREKARALSPDEILSPKIQDLIQKMIRAMRDAPGVGLAAPQIGESIQLAVIEDVNQSHLTPEQLKERDRFPVPLHVIINPRLYIEKEAFEASFFEGCLSVPGLIGIVPRAVKVRVECLNEKGEATTIRAQGWYARILQHEIGHLHGELFLDHAKPHTLTTLDNYDRYWSQKSISQILSTTE